MIGWEKKNKKDNDNNNNYYNKELQDSRTKIVTLPWKKINPKMEKKYTRMRARMKVKMMDRRLPVTALITFCNVSSRKIISTN